MHAVCEQVLVSAAGCETLTKVALGFREKRSGLWCKKPFRGARKAWGGKFRTRVEDKEEGERLGIRLRGRASGIEVPGTEIKGLQRRRGCGRRGKLQSNCQHQNKQMNK